MIRTHIFTSLNHDNRSIPAAQHLHQLFELLLQCRSIRYRALRWYTHGVGNLRCHGACARNTHHCQIRWCLYILQIHGMRAHAVFCKVSATPVHTDYRPSYTAATSHFCFEQRHLLRDRLLNHLKRCVKRNVVHSVMSPHHTPQPSESNTRAVC